MNDEFPAERYSKCMTEAKEWQFKKRVDFIWKSAYRRGLLNGIILGVNLGIFILLLMRALW